MNFETEYKNIKFHITLEKAEILDASVLLGDKFNRLPNQTMIAIKKGMLIPFNLIIKSTNDQMEVSELTHYWSNILLTSKADELLEELGHFLDDEDILESIVTNWQLGGSLEGPAWKLTP
jgi:hypothetical protein